MEAVYVNIWGIWMKNTQEFLALCLQRFGESEILSKQKVKINKQVATKSYMCTSFIHSFIHFVEHLLCARWFFQAQNKTDKNPTVVELGGNSGGGGGGKWSKERKTVCQMVLSAK